MSRTVILILGTSSDNRICMKRQHKTLKQLQGVPKKMPHSELRLLGPYRAPLKLTLGLNTPIYDTRVCVGTKETLTLPYIVPYSPYKTTVGTPVSHPKSARAFLRDCRDCRAL